MPLDKKGTTRIEPGPLSEKYERYLCAMCHPLARSLGRNMFLAANNYKVTEFEAKMFGRAKSAS